MLLLLLIINQIIIIFTAKKEKNKATNTFGANLTADLTQLVAGIK